MKVNITIDDFRLKSNLYINQISIFTKKCFFHTVLGFTQSHQGPLNDIKRFYQILPWHYKSQKPINISGNKKSHLKRTVVDGSIVNDSRKPILDSFGLDKPPGHKIYKKPRNKL